MAIAPNLRLKTLKNVNSAMFISKVVCTVNILSGLRQKLGAIPALWYLEGTTRRGVGKEVQYVPKVYYKCSHTRYCKFTTDAHHSPTLVKGNCPLSLLARLVKTRLCRNEAIQRCYTGIPVSLRRPYRKI